MNGKIQKIISLIIILIFVFCDFSIDVLYLQSIPVPVVKLKTVSTVHADVYCLPPNEGGQTPVFDPVIGFCTLPPLDPYGKCAAPYVYSTTNKVCILTPICSGAEYWDADAKQCVAYTGGVSVPGDTTPVFPDNSCAVDLNGNGEVEQDEIFQCTQTPQGYICPQGQAECNPQYTQPTCPAEYTYDPATQKCVATVSCPSGGSYDPSLDKCTTGTIVIVSCPSGFTYNSSRNVCEASPTWIKTCPAGWDGPYDVYDTPPPFGDCHDCYVFLCDNRGSNCNYYSMCNYNRFYNVCVSYYIESYGDPECHNFAFVVEEHSIAPAQNTPSCSQGQYNSQTGMCEVSLSTSVSCPAGYVLAGNYCVSNANCPSGGTLNTTTDRCEANATCSTGTLQSQGCLTGYSCPLGNYQCQQVGSRWMCSPYQCITQSQIQDEGDIIAAGLEDDGQRDASGNCLGTVYIFNGKKMRCRKTGIQTGFHNCCDESRGKLYDSTGSTGLTSIPDMIKTIAAVYSVLKLGSIIYKAQFVTINLTKNTVNVLTGPGSVITYSLNSAEGVAIANTMMQYGTQVGQIGNPAEFGATFIPGSASKDVLVGSTMQKYIQELGPQIAWAIAQLAISRIIKDPALSSAVNLVGTVALMALGKIPVNYFMIALEVISLVMSLFMQRCDLQDIETSTFNDSRYCHEVGEYCVKKWPLVGCVQKAKGFCCFNSKLARIIHEQGRPQLAGFGPGGGWGQPKNPNCRGFLPEEFQALDFNKIDLSEYVEDIQKNVRTNLQQNLQQQFNQTMQDLTGY